VWLVDAGQVLGKRSKDDAKRERDAAVRLIRFKAVWNYRY
jgi:hypothetical protein